MVIPTEGRLLANPSPYKYYNTIVAFEQCPTIICPARAAGRFVPNETTIVIVLHLLALLSLGTDLLVGSVMNKDFIRRAWLMMLAAPAPIIARCVRK